MKIAVIGDTHGRDTWKKIDKENYDKIIFIGDYFDSFNIPFVVQIDNFNKIIDFKIKNSDKVILLLGNHDFHYMHQASEKYSGFQSSHMHDANEVIEKAVRDNLIQMCYKYNKYLFTHAGVTKTWLNKSGYVDSEVDEFINDLLKYKPSSFRFAVGANHSYSGDDITQSPIWVRPKSLIHDSIDDVIQVVGHTRQNEIEILDNFIFIDVLDNKNQILEITDDIVTKLDL